MVIIWIAAVERVELASGIRDLAFAGKGQSSGDVGLVVFDILLNEVALDVTGIDFLQQLCCFGKRTISDTGAGLRQLSRFAFKLHGFDLINRDRPAARRAFGDGYFS